MHQTALRRVVVGVMGSGKEPWVEFAEPLAVWIAQQGYHLLTGGGKGVMEVAARAFCATPNRTGLSMAILPSEPYPDRGFVAKAGYPNDWVELPIVTPLPTYDPSGQGIINGHGLSRNFVNILTSTVIVALPG